MDRFRQRKREKAIASSSITNTDPRRGEPQNRVVVGADQVRRERATHSIIRERQTQMPPFQQQPPPPPTPTPAHKGSTEESPASNELERKLRQLDSLIEGSPASTHASSSAQMATARFERKLQKVVAVPKPPPPEFAGSDDFIDPGAPQHEGLEALRHENQRLRQEKRELEERLSKLEISTKSALDADKIIQLSQNLQGHVDVLKSDLEVIADRYLSSWRCS